MTGGAEPRAWRGCRGLIALIAMALITEALYLVFVVRPFSLLDHYDTPYMDLGKLTKFSADGAVWFFVPVAILFAIYLLALVLVKRMPGRQAMVAIVAGAFVFGATLVFVYPIGALDVFGYVFQGKVLGLYHLNPFFVPASHLPQDAMFGYLAWIDEPSNYGSLWVLAGGLMALGYGQSMLSGLLVFKVVGLVCLLLTAAMVAVVAKQDGSVSPAFAATFVAWNPLVLYEVVVNGHNDIAMALLALVAIYAALRSKVASSLLSVAASALIKFVTAVLYPVLLVWFWRRRPEGLSQNRKWLWSAAVGILASGALVALTYAPFWGGLQTIGAFRRGGLYTASFPALTYYGLSESGVAGAGTIASWVFMGAFVAFLVFRLVGIGSSSQSLFNACFDVLLAYLILATMWFQPWYLVLVVPFGAVLVCASRRGLCLVFCASAFLNYLVFDFLWIWYPSVLGLLQVQALAVGCIFGPVVVYLLWLAIANWRRRSLTRSSSRVSNTFAV